jgi:hypothetical protein
MEIEQLFENLMNEASSRKQTSLRIINNICNEQILRNSPDFSIATIGKISKLQGGPSEQAIRNKNGEAYRLLITAWSINPNRRINPFLDPIILTFYNISKIHLSELKLAYCSLKLSNFEVKIEYSKH